MLNKINPITTRPHLIMHVDPKDHSKILRVERTVQKLAPTADRLTTISELAQYRHVAVKRGPGIGDCLMLLPAMKALKEELPELDVTLAVPSSCIELFSSLPYIDHIRDVSALQEYLYDRVIDVSYFAERHPLKDKVNRATIFGRAFGVDLSNIKFEIPLTADEIKFGKGFLEELEKPVIGICPWANRDQSNWPHAKEFANEFKRKHGGSIVCITDRRGGISWADVTTDGLGLLDVACILKHLDLLVTSDTGPMHLAFAVDTPMVLALFGVSKPELRINQWTRYCALLAQDVDCIGCDMSRRAFMCGHECMEQLTTEIVMESIDVWLKYIKKESIDALY